MSEIDKYKDQKQKLENLCNEHDLTFRFDHDSYPLMMSIRPLQGVYAQISMLEEAEDGKNYISQDASLTFYKKEAEVLQQITGVFTISESLVGKFRNIFKKLCDYWEQYFFRSIMETHAIKRRLMPVIDEDEEKTAAGPLSDEELGQLNDEENPGENDGTPDEDLLAEATKLVRIENKCTLSLLQRRLRVSYAKGLHILDLLEERGVVGSVGENGKREVLPYDVPESPEA